MAWDKLVKWITAALGGIAGLLGEWNAMLTALGIVMTVDYVSGLLCAIRGKSPKTEGGGLSSKVGAEGLCKKGMILLVVFLATVLDGVIGGDARMFQPLVVGYYVGNEGLSILENAGLLGVPFPPKLKNILEALRNKGSAEEKNGE